MTHQLASALAVLALVCPDTWAQVKDLEGSATLLGWVRDSRERPLAAATVHLQAKNKEQTLTARTDSGGSYRFSGLHAGTYILRAETRDGGTTAFGPFVLGQDESKRVDLKLEPETAADKPEFFDEPHFTVAGVTDNTYRGAHGSDTPLRSTEALTKATASLKEPSAVSTPDAERHHSLADLNERQGKPLEAVREYQRAAELDASEPNLFDWGTELLTHRAADPAIEVFAKGTRLFPHSARMLLGLAVALYARGSYDEAERRFVEATDLNPGDSVPYLFLGKVQNREIRQSDGYVERLARFATLRPNSALANYYYAVVLWNRRADPNDVRTVKQVKVLLNKAIQLDPKLGPAYLQLGILYSEQKDFANAFSAYQKAIEVSPEMEEAHYRLSQAYGLTGQKLKAQEELDHYKQLSKKSAEEAERERQQLQQFVFALRRQK